MDRLSPSQTRLLLLGLSILAAGSIAWGSAYALKSSSDLMLRRAESLAFVAGLDPYQIPDMTYPPSAPAILVGLIAPFEPRVLRVFWLGLNLIALAWLIHELLVQFASSWPAGLKAAFTLGVLSEKSIRLGLGMGQLHLLPLVLTLAADRMDREGKPWTGGLLLGLALVKPTMALPFAVWFLVRRSYRMLLSAAAVQAGAIAAASVWLDASPIRLFKEWLDRAGGQVGSGAIDVPSLLIRTWPNAPISAGLVSLTILVLGGCVAWVLRRGSNAGLFAWNALVASVFAYHRPYDLVLLAPVCAFLVSKAQLASSSELARWLATAFMVMLAAPNQPLDGTPLASWYPLVLISGVSVATGAVLFLLITESKAAKPHESAENRAKCCIGEKPVGHASAMV